MANNSLWHEVSDSEKEKIRADAKKLLTEFSSKLEKLNTKDAKDSHFKKDSGYREEGEGWNTDPDFKDHMFHNAPFTDGNSIVAEKGSWKK